MNENLIKKRKRNFWSVMLALAIVIGMMPFAADDIFADASKTFSGDVYYEFYYRNGFGWEAAYNNINNNSGAHSINVGDKIVNLKYNIYGGYGTLYIGDNVGVDGNKYSGTVIDIVGDKLYLRADSAKTSESTEVITDKVEEKEKVYVDLDTYKSELSSKSVIVKDKYDVKMSMDMKAHALDDATAANQKILASYFASQMGKEANVITGYGIYPRRDLSITESGSKKMLEWNNLSYKTPGVIYAVCYNQKDGSYLISGIVNNKGTAIFDNYILRDATNVTVFTLK